ncbi:trypsin-like serine protease [Promicromonospora kroppenstedtii]|uniref:Trypsin-like serine protease n=1 Tax=Promicromonospora kroppenstedtii TaxID=440482 RepID=A0ABW7XS85_9MICO
MAGAVVGSPSVGEQTFTARLDIGDGQRACTGALVDPEWILTAASCFVEDLAVGIPVAAGKPALETTATIGRIDLTGTAGQVRRVVELVPHETRDLVLARLGVPVTGIVPATVGATTPAVADQVQVPGYGRTATEWSPLQRHSGNFTVDQVTGSDIGIAGQAGAVLCAGDSGAPALRSGGSGTELVAVVSRSWQRGCFGSDPTETRTGAVMTAVGDVRDWVTATATRGELVDLNCDGIRDVAIGDPDATVNGLAQAGLVRVIYGGNKGVAEITQNSPSIFDDAEAGDRFGYGIATYDRDLDGCTDLVISAPWETRGENAAAGLVHVTHGHPDGLLAAGATPGTAFRQGSGVGAIRDALEQANERMGFSVAAGRTDGGKPYVLIGVPGKNFGTTFDAGIAYYVQSEEFPAGAEPVESAIILRQGVGGLRGGGEAYDEFGYSVAADGRYMAIGVPGEGGGTDGEANAGLVSVIRHPENGAYSEIAALHQDLADVSATSEEGDRFGESVDVAQFRREGATDNSSLLAVGVPGEAVGTLAAAGRVVTFELTPSSAWAEVTSLRQARPGSPVMDGEPAADDRFGAAVSVVNRTPGGVATNTSLLVAAGTPGDTSGAAGAARGGSVSVVSALGGAAGFQALIHPGDVLPGTPQAGDSTGNALLGSSTHLYVGQPGGGSYGRVYGVPLTTLVDGGADPVVTYQPGTSGLPAVGAAFGSAIG